MVEAIILIINQPEIKCISTIYLCLLINGAFQIECDDVTFNTNQIR